MFISDSLGYRTNGIRLFVKKIETIDGVFVGATSPRRNYGESVAITERYYRLKQERDIFSIFAKNDANVVYNIFRPKVNRLLFCV